MVKFLIIRFSSIGDIVLCSPVIRELHKAVEDAEIHFIVKPAFKTILEKNPYIHKIHLLDEVQSKTTLALKEENFDYIIDLQNNFRSMDIKRSLKKMYFTVDKVNFKKWLYVNFKIDKLPHKHIVDRYLDTVKVFDAKNDGSGLDYFIPEEDRVSLSELPEAFRKGYIVLVTGAQHQTKKLPVEQIIKLTEGLLYPVILIGGENEREEALLIQEKSQHPSIYNACGKWNLGQSASIIEQSRLVISHDTGMMHIAAAFHKKILAIWGNTTPRFGMYPYMPHEESENFEVNGLSCRPCSKIGKASCPKKHFRCMMDQDLEGIAEKANRLFLK